MGRSVVKLRPSLGRSGKSASAVARPGLLGQPPALPQSALALEPGWSRRRAHSTESGSQPAAAGGKKQDISTAASSSSSSQGQQGGSGAKDQAAPFDVKVVQMPGATAGTGHRPMALLGAASVAAAGAGAFALWRQRRMAQELQEQAAARAAEEQARKKAAADEARAAVAAKAAAEAAARAAQEAAEAEARTREELAALAEVYQRRQAEVQQVLEAAAAGPERLEQLAELGAALASADEFVADGSLQRLQDSEEHKCSPWERLPELLGLARSRLQELEVLIKARQRYEAATDALMEKGQLLAAGQDLDSRSCREVLLEAEQATEALTAAGEQGWSSELLEAFRDHVSVLERSEEEARLRASCAEALQAAVSARPVSPAACSEALAAAQAAGCAPCAAGAIARVVVEESQDEASGGSPLQQLVKELRDAAPNGPGQLLGLASGKEEDFVSAAAASAKLMSEAELQAQAAELARALCVHQQLEAEDLRRGFQALRPQLLQHASQRAAGVLQRFGEEKAAAFDVKKVQVEGFAAIERERLTAQATDSIEERVTEVIDDARKQTHVEIVAHLKQEDQTLEAFLAQLSAGVLAALDGLRQDGRSPEQRVAATNGLTSALLSFGSSAELESAHGGLEDNAALKAAASSGLGADAFTERLAAHLPEATVQRSQRPLPAWQDLSLSFRAQLPSFVAAAFEPPQSTEMAGGIAAQIAGRVFAWLYRLRAVQEELASEAAIAAQVGGRTPAFSSSSSNSGVAATAQPADLRQQNLRTLAWASGLVERGELREALEMLEGSLSGRCRLQAEKWMLEARHALLLRQAAQAALARNMCLNASLAERR
eukprot:TRINITY_DN23358_c0_g1_i1.p1 TRINITY_DN23358_c0_g1~~TRINITY_DN23358_c0_g1_i1.p1  ORF type:complete len:834 (+),score=251.05 TRINITY_DN23358_c0_g1_i1:53-2554(+)